MLSKLRHFVLVDIHRRRARLRDLAIALKADYPPVTHLFYRNAKGQEAKLPWKAVRKIAWHRKEISVASLLEGEVTTTESSTKEILLRRDVMDALVLDLHNRRATRANDLWLEEKEGALLLTAADTSAWAVLRRLSRGHFGSKPSRAPYDWKYIEFLRGDPHAVRSGSGYQMRIGRLPPGEIAGLSRSLPYLHAAELITLLPDPLAADALEAMPPARRLQVFAELETKQALSLLAIMAPDDAVDLLGSLPPDVATNFLERLPENRLDRLIDLLRYPENTVGGIMTNDVVVLPIAQSVGEARGFLRERLEEPDFAYFIYVVEDDETRHLRGTLSLREFLRAKDSQRLEELMNPYISTLDPLERADVGSFRVINAQMPALPVVAQDGRLLGILTVDAAVAQVAPASWSSQAPRVFS